MVVLCSGQEVCLHHLLGVIGRDLPETGVSLMSPLGQLQVKVAPAAVHLQHLDGVGVRVVDLNDRAVAGVEGELHPDQWFDSVRVGSARA